MPKRSHFLPKPQIFYTTSTYTVKSGTAMTFKKKFTFHYVSTYTTKLPNPHKLIFSFTFHYVSTYTQLQIPAWQWSDYIYIPLCFYLYLWCAQVSTAKESIYIPLCFYLYYTESISALQLYNLHSTMFLLILSFRIRQIHKIIIYIPLCFYLYVTVGH